MPKVFESIRRNPIQIVAAVVILGMVIQKLVSGESIEGTDWGIYFLNFAMSYVAREFTVPLREHEEIIDDLERSNRFDN